MIGELPNTIELRRVADGVSVTANIVPLTRDLAQKSVDGAWWQLEGVSGTARQEENDHGWEWTKRLGELRNDRWHRAFALQPEEGDIQGAMLYWVNGVSFVDPTLTAIQVEALATAPRNRPWLVENPVYRGVGTGLMVRAVAHSYILGLKGRMNLLAFDDSRVLEFYGNRGFEIVGYDGELPQLELSPDNAIEWMRKEGYDV